MTTPTIKLYHAAGSRSIRVRWTLEEMGLPYNLERLTLAVGQTGGSDYTAIHPSNKLPAMIVGDEIILESLACIEYLITKFGPTDLVISPDHKLYGRYLELFHFGESGMTMAMNLLIAHLLLLPEEQRSKRLADWARSEMDKHINYLMIRSLGDGRPWMIGDQFTAADISVGYMMFLLKIMKILPDLPQEIRDYFDRVTARDAWKKASFD